jgi:hypothetical protein
MPAGLSVVGRHSVLRQTHGGSFKDPGESDEKFFM